MQQIAAHFRLEGAPASCQRYGSGHINETYLVETTAKHLYILQKINHTIFRDVPSLMRNIALVTGHLAKNDPDPRHVLTLVKTAEGGDYYRDEGGYYRVYEFVTESLCLQQAESDEDFYQSGVAFGGFQQQLSDFPAETLTETIPRFHDTANRYALLREAVEKDALGRAEAVRAEIDFALARAGDVKMAQGLPLRVTHNDTKLNNVLLDEKTRKPLCVIDLDTVMPGLSINDFGDSIRFGASTATEDEKDLSRVSLSLPLYAAYAKGFLQACGRALTGAEIAALPAGAKLMTLECGVRFLTDYLSGDVYFRIHRPEHNLDRTRTQFTLVADMERKWADMADITAREAGAAGAAT